MLTDLDFDHVREQTQITYLNTNHKATFIEYIIISITINLYG